MNMDDLGLIKILKNKTNFEIIKKLQSAKTISELCYESRLNESSVTKSLLILHQFNIIEKNNQSYTLAKLGNQILSKQRGLRFLTDNSSYFQSHCVEDIPSSFITRVENFSGCEVVHSIWPSISRLQEIAINARKLIRCAFSQPPFVLAESIHEKINSGAKFQLLFGNNNKISEFNDLVIKLELNKPRPVSIFEKRMCDKIITNVMISENKACLMLANHENEPDMTSAIIGQDEGFIQWCNDFFEYKWENAEPFARLRTSN